MESLTKPKLNVHVPDLEEGAGAWSLDVDRLNPYAWTDNVFSVDDCQSIIELMEGRGLKRGRVFGRGKHEESRNSYVRFLFPDDATYWIFERITGVLIDMNKEYFGFDLTGMNEGIQFTRYSAPGEKYDWHFDSTYGQARRKLSLSIQLSDPNSYEGGNFEIMTGNATSLSRDQGTMLVFPSYMNHRVTPVTSGVRYSLVAWVTGPAFR